MILSDRPRPTRTACYQPGALSLAEPSKRLLSMAPLTSTNQKLIIIQMTTFGGRGLHKRDPVSRLQYLPIDPAPPHPDNGKQLTFEHSCRLRKKGWVKLKTFKCPMSVLTPFVDVNLGKVQPKVRHLRLLSGQRTHLGIWSKGSVEY